METLSVDIMNPVAKEILYNLAELKLIVINEPPDFQTEFKTLLEKLRSQKETAPSPEEIQREVDIARTQWYEKKDHEIKNHKITGYLYQQPGETT